MKFLAGEDSSAALRELLGRREALKIAVAYIGQDATKLLSARRGADLQVICDLQSGACHPGAVAELMKHFEVRSRPDLHAKVYLGRDKAILGSSNLSSNGIGISQNVSAGLLEANIELDESDLLAEIHTWYDQLWETSEDIDEDDLAYAREAWERRQNLAKALRLHRRPQRTTDSLLAAAQKAPKRFKNVWIVFTWAARSSAGQSKHEELVAEAAERSEFIDSYDGWPELPKGAWLIDLSCVSRKSRNADYCGVWKTPAKGLFADYGQGPNRGTLTIVYRSPVPDGVKVGGKHFRLTKEEISFLKAHTRQIINLANPPPGDPTAILRLGDIEELGWPSR